MWHCFWDQRWAEAGRAVRKLFLEAGKRATHIAETVSKTVTCSNLSGKKNTSNQFVGLAKEDF